jgi:hypothetical protein
MKSLNKENRAEKRVSNLGPSGYEAEVLNFILLFLRVQLVSLRKTED